MGFVIMLQRIVDWIAANKLVTFLGVALFAFFVATIALAVENNDNADALQSCQNRLYAATSTTAAPTQAPEPTSTAAPATSESTEAPAPTPETPAPTAETPAPGPSEQNSGRKRRSANTDRQRG